VWVTGGKRGAPCCCFYGDVWHSYPLSFVSGYDMGDGGGPCPFLSVGHRAAVLYLFLVLRLFVIPSRLYAASQSLFSLCALTVVL
jgi:hypothetical protein